MKCGWSSDNKVAHSSHLMVVCRSKKNLSYIEILSSSVPFLSRRMFQWSVKMSKLVKNLSVCSPFFGCPKWRQTLWYRSFLHKIANVLPVRILSLTEAMKLLNKSWKNSIWYEKICRGISIAAKSDFDEELIVITSRGKYEMTKKFEETLDDLVITSTPLKSP